MFNYDRKSERRCAIKPVPINPIIECHFCNSNNNVGKCIICLKNTCLNCKNTDICIDCDYSPIKRSSKKVESELSLKNRKNNIFYCCQLL